MKYKITIGTQLEALNGIIIFTILVSIAILLMGINDGFKLDLFVFFIGFYVVNFGAVMFVHYQYYKVNKDLELVIDQDKKQLEFKTKNYVRTIKIEEIKKVDIFVMPSIYRGSNIQILPFESYHFAVIHTSGNEVLIVTSLMNHNLINLFKSINIKVIRNKCLYPSLNKIKQ